MTARRYLTGLLVLVCATPAWGVAGQDLPLLIVGRTKTARGIELALRNDGPLPLVAWTVMVRQANDDSPNGDEVHHTHDRLRALVLQRLAEGTPGSAVRTGPLQPGSTAVMLLGSLADVARDVRVVAVVYADGTGAGDEQQLQSIRRQRERIGAAIDRWLPAVSLARKQSDPLRQMSTLRGEISRRVGSMVNGTAHDDEYPDLLQQVLSTGQRNVASVPHALDQLEQYMVTLRSEISRGIRAASGGLR